MYNTVETSDGHKQFESGSAGTSALWGGFLQGEGL